MKNDCVAHFEESFTRIQTDDSINFRPFYRKMSAEINHWIEQISNNEKIKDTPWEVFS